MMTAAPPIWFQLRCSPRRATPASVATRGITYVTVEATVAPASRIRPYCRTYATPVPNAPRTQLVGRRGEEREDDRQFCGADQELTGRQRDHRVTRSGEMAAQVDPAEAVAGGRAECHRRADRGLPGRTLPDTEHDEHAHETHDQAGAATPGRPLVPQREHGDQQREQRGRGVADPGERRGDALLGDGEQGERHRVEQHRGHREMRPHPQTAREPLASCGQHGDQRERPERHPSERDLQRRQRLGADLDQDEARPPDHCEGEEAQLPGNSSKSHGTYRRRANRLAQVKPSSLHCVGLLRC